MSTIHITVNGQSLALPHGCTLADCVAAAGQVAQTIATAVNGQFVPRDRRATCALQDGDAVFTFSPITGG